MYVLRGSRKQRERRYFPESVKKQKLRDQNYKCAICKRSTGVWDYDHIDGNRSNNNPCNLQLLCPNCHAKKSRGLLKQKEIFTFTMVTSSSSYYIIFLYIWKINHNLPLQRV